MNQALGRGRGHGRAAHAGQPRLGCRPATTLTISPDDALGAGHLPHGHGAGRGPGPDRPAARPPGPSRLPDPPTGRPPAIASTPPVGKRVSVETAFAVTFARPVDPTTVADGDPARARRRPATRPGRPARRRARSRYVFVPSKPLQAGHRRTASSSAASATRTASPSAIESLAVRTITAPGRRPLPPARRRQGRAARCRDLRPLHRADGSPQHGQGVHGRRSAARPIKGKISWAESNTVLVFKPASRAAVRRPRWSPRSRHAPGAPNGAPLATSGPGDLQDRREAARPKPVAKPATSRRQRRWRRRRSAAAAGRRSRATTCGS